MVHFVRYRLAFFLAVLLLAGAEALEGQVARVFVSVAGSDANTCSNVATPCRSFSAAMTQVDAGGEVIVIKGGDYAGATIAKSVTITVSPGIVAVVTAPMGVYAGVNDVVTLRGLTIKAPTPGTYWGVDFSTAKAVHVERCVIEDWNEGINSRDTAGARQLFVKDTAIRNASDNGIYLASTLGTIQASVDGCRIEGNFYGVQVGGGGKATLKRSVLSGNYGGANAANFVNGTSAELNVEDCVLSNNSQIGVAVNSANGGSATARVSRSTVTENGIGIGQSGGGVLASAGNNTVKGNNIDTAGTISSLTLR
jgi:hypothetical protein